MFIWKSMPIRIYVWNRLLSSNVSSFKITRHLNNSGITYLNDRCSYPKYNDRSRLFQVVHRKWYSKLLDGDVSELSVTLGKELKKISDLFPQPRVTLNELSSKTPDKIFEIHYKQNTVAPKGRKKVTQHNDWTCTYAFVWPEKNKFESTAISKRQAAEKAAMQAVHWLYTIHRIDSKGQPLYNNTVLDKIKSNLNETLSISISDKSVEKIETIWKEYESEIKPLYQRTFQEAKNKIISRPAFLNKDSTIDEDDMPETDRDLSQETSVDLSEVKQKVHPVYGRSITPPKAVALERRERALQRTFQNYEEELTSLPIDEYSDLITSTVEKSRVTVLVGAAGCGKSSRAPAAVLRSCGAKTAAIVTEPRRVAAIGLAERVAQELGEEVGDTVGYQVRLHSKLPRPPGGSILYCTSGVLLRRLQSNPGLEGCTHVFIDEAHERDVNTDLTLLLLKNALDLNPELKLIVMSATLDTEVFTRYFDSCPVLEVPGRTYPVDITYLEDIQKKYNLALTNTRQSCLKEEGRPQVHCQEVSELIKAIDKREGEGAILVFLPGWAEIKLTKQLLDEQLSAATHLILPVHSRLSTSDQSRMFAKPPPGVRKIVLATNIAETSVTVPDVVYVLDTGAHKENTLREGTGTASLETVWVSLAGAKQRAGRAGRVQPGHCFRMYTKEKEAEFSPHTTPEILRVPLEQTVLDCKTYAPNVKIADFFSQLPEPPNSTAIQFAVNDLIDLGALTPSEDLTRLGGLLSSLTLHPRLGRTVLNAAFIGNLVAAANCAVHCSQNTELFVNAPDRRDEIREIKRGFSANSDHSALHSIQDQYENVLETEGRRDAELYCQKYGMRADRLNHVKSLSKLHIEQVLKSGVIPATTEAQDLNRFSDIDQLTSAVLLSGANALLLTKRQVKTKGKLATVVGTFTSKGERAHISTESLNYGVTKRATRPCLLAYFGGYHSAERRALVLYKTSLITPHAAVLFSDGQINRETEDDEITTLSLRRHRLKIDIPTSQAEHMLRVREMLWDTLDYHVQRNINNLDYEEHTTTSSFKVRLIKTIGRILVEGDREFIQGKARLDSIEQ